MYVIIAYDISVERVNKVKGYLRTQLTWVQNSLFEGEITESRYLRIAGKLAELIEPGADTITIYKFPNKSVIERIDLGITKGHPDDIIL
ncbi:CRISPR-associated endonuclease Cas2 [Candidatus Micrarchaeota archaeon CG08_land_8_20_14_0_20_49_17]|nr:MAG: CRISPR-associated endonuclease Cas2 [Candidatus Micrarchaeota archaeon CG1_02_49_24]PIU09910.1 MAG: CRISPR-associated endonuclease Cas2 [Candidatus Micrarchaeota archaeon CG08_land_8_20_14_0_20_49_17]HII53309.1 CRISPR-associated endonuclease Cas2 [Candidatus Micrarchaeota archaeon]